MVKRIDINDKVIQLDEIEDKLRRTTVQLFLDAHHNEVVSAKQTLMGLSERLNDQQVEKMLIGSALPDLDMFMVMSLWLDNRTYREKVRRLSERILELKGQLTSRGITPKPDHSYHGGGLGNKYKDVAALFREFGGTP